MSTAGPIRANDPSKPLSLGVKTLDYPVESHELQIVLMRTDPQMRGSSERVFHGFAVRDIPVLNHRVGVHSSVRLGLQRCAGETASFVSNSPFGSFFFTCREGVFISISCFSPEATSNIGDHPAARSFWGFEVE